MPGNVTMPLNKTEGKEEVQNTSVQLVHPLCTPILIVVVLQTSDSHVCNEMAWF